MHPPVARPAAPRRRLLAVLTLSAAAIVSTAPALPASAAAPASAAPSTGSRSPRP
jgi:hypothetical protein